MRVMSQYELLRLNRMELMGLLRTIEGELPGLTGGSAELRNAYVNLQSIRMALARPGLQPR